MIRALLIALVVLAVGACESPRLSGIAADVGIDLEPPTPAPVDPSVATFAFLPIPGIPGDAADEMLRRLWTRAEREGLNVVKRPGGRALFTVEGTLTAVADDTNALVFFVFDVKDVEGKRLHRISGQQTSEESENDPWASVEERDIDLIARRVTALLRAWLYARA
ncbi:MAG: hypothetical protein AAGJ94_11170 [Pseudomonadota bacterium]